MYDLWYLMLFTFFFFCGKENNCFYCILTLKAKNFFLTYKNILKNVERKSRGFTLGNAC